MKTTSAIAKILHEEIDYSHLDWNPSDECPICIDNAKRIMAAIDVEAEYHDIGERVPTRQEEWSGFDFEICM